MHQADVVDPVDPKTSSPEAIGHALRLAVDAEYARLVETRTFRMPATWITPTVEPFIPVGSTFERAERILRAAGLTIDGSRNDSIHPDSYALRARIEPYPEGWRFFRVCRQTLSINLSPQSTMRLGHEKTIDSASIDWSEIRRVEASISNVCL